MEGRLSYADTAGSSERAQRFPHRAARPRPPLNDLPSRRQRPDGLPAGHVRERLRAGVGEGLDDDSERVFAIDELIGTPRQEGPNFGSLTSAFRDDPRHQFVEVGSVTQRWKMPVRQY